jgi:uncharacterized protein YndB with AHSA1/START domain
MSDDGVVRQVPGGFEIRFERYFNHPVEKVWDAITRPEQLSQWLGDATIDLRAGGRFRMAMSAEELEAARKALADQGYDASDMDDASMDGEVLTVEPPRVLEYMWDSRDFKGGSLRWELTPDGSGTRLVLTHVNPPETFEEFRVRTLAGWHALLDLLGLMVDGVPARDRFMELWQTHHSHYEEASQ